jgi:hypothetical protein
VLGGAPELVDLVGLEHPDGPGVGRNAPERSVVSNPRVVNSTFWPRGRRMDGTTRVKVRVKASTWLSRVTVTSSPWESGCG